MHCPHAPLLLLLDGHSSHYHPGFIKRAAEEKATVFCLPLHTTHLTQPLDKGSFGPLKMFRREECQAYLAEYPGKIVTRFQFSQLFSKAWYKGMSMSNAIAGFHITGIFPFNRFACRAPDDKYLKPKSIAEKTGLKYIPILTPVLWKQQSKTSTPTFTTEEILAYQKRFV